jgi:hypothetical protein
MTFDVEVVLKGRDRAVVAAVSVPHDAARAMPDSAVREVLVEILRAIERAQNPEAARDRAVVLTGFSWIVEPNEDAVVIAIEIPMGAAVAGPFASTVDELTAQITRVLRTERQMMAPGTVH